MYEFLCDFLRKNAPDRAFESVKVVAGNGFFNQEVIFELGFTNAKFIYNRWHLLNLGLKGMCEFLETDGNFPWLSNLYATQMFLLESLLYQTMFADAQQ